MDTVSKQYREAMAARLRDRSYMRITMGVVNYDAQDKGVPTFAPTTFFSNSQVIGANDNNSTYAGFDACTVDGGHLGSVERESLWHIGTILNAPNAEAVQSIRKKRKEKGIDDPLPIMLDVCL